jgi:hypothetical protein
MARRSRVEGTTALRKKLRRIDPAIKQEIADVVIAGLEAIKRDAQAMVPVDTGDLRNSIEVQFSKRDGVSGLVGPGAKAAEIVRRKSDSKTSFGGWKYRLSKKNKAALYEFFKGYWIEFGTKGNAKKNIPAQPARPFMAPAYLKNRAWIAEKARIAVDKVLVRIASG